MPWKVDTPVSQREELVAARRAHRVPVSQLARLYGVTRKTVYKWLARADESGRAGLQDRSRARLTQGHQLDDAVVSRILEEKERHPTWGAKKLHTRLGTKPPSVSSIHRVLQHHGKVKQQKRRRRTEGGLGTVPPIEGPNDLWNIDYKGHIRLGNGRLCLPLTLTDQFSRYVLLCEALTSTRTDDCWACLERVLREHGVPRAIRSDNGVPFAGSGAGRLTRLSVRLMRQGIELVRIPKGCPQANGSHERMHRTLKEETARPPRGSLRAQQAAFDAFREMFNEERPHEALGQVTPGSLYEISERSYQEAPPEPEYPGHWEVRSVRTRGYVKLGRRAYFVSEALVGERVGLIETDEGVWLVQYFNQPVAEIDERTGRVSPLGGVIGGGGMGTRYGRPEAPSW